MYSSVLSIHHRIVKYLSYIYVIMKNFAAFQVRNLCYIPQYPWKYTQKNEADYNLFFSCLRRHINYLHSYVYCLITYSPCRFETLPSRLSVRPLTLV